MIIQNSRIVHKRSIIASTIPTVPTSDDHTDGSWTSEDIYKGEFFNNLVDGKLFTRFDSGIVELTTENSGHFWKPTGNTLAARAVFGSTSGAYGWDYKINNTVVGSWSNSGLFTALNGLSTDGVKTIDINTTTSNIKIGESAGNSIAVGSELNVYIGKNAGEGSDGDSNFFGGWLSGYSANVDASVGIGAQSLRLADGTSLLGIGSNAGYGYVGLNSVFIGNGAGTNGTDNYNVYIGDATGENATGNNKVGIDRRALRNSTGNKQFGIGAFAGEDLTDANTGVFGPYYDIYFNGHLENAGYELFQHSVTLQTQMSVAGTNVSSATNVLKLAPSRGTGNAVPPPVVVQKVNVQASGTTRQTLSDWFYFDNGNLGIGGQSYGSGDGAIFIANAGTVPSANPTGGGILYVESGALKYRGSSGTITTIAIA